MMKNFRLVLTLVSILVVSAVTVQAQEEGVIEVLSKIFGAIAKNFKSLGCQMLYGGDCPEPYVAISQLALFLMIAVLTYDILYTASPLSQWVCGVFGFALAAISANSGIIQAMYGWFVAFAAGNIAIAMPLTILATMVIFFGYWFVGGWFINRMLRAKAMKEAKRVGWEKAKPILELREMAEAATE